MYALLVAALACVGASAGTIFFTGNQALSVPFSQALNRCALRFPVVGYLSPFLPELDRCTEGAYRSE